jgi:glycosyltransferase involved in cell wall biosynthesis
MKPVVHVLLATYNGERHLPEQWASLEAQQGVDLVVHIGDDGSGDGTMQVLHRLAAQPAGAVVEVRWLDEPPRRSATKSFMMLLQSALGDPQASWFAFCDQDDVWLPNKLQAALAAIGNTPLDRPALYGGRTLSVDEDGRPGGLSPLFRKPPCFRNAMVQSIMGGNTMLMNRAAAMALAGSAATAFTAHDWFSYQLITGLGGVVHYDPTPYVHYRQHADNVVGSNLGWGARWRRLKRMINGDFSQWNDLHVSALLSRAAQMLPENREVLAAFDRARRNRSPFARLLWLSRSGVFRQTPLQQLTLWVGCLLHRI